MITINDLSAWLHQTPGPDTPVGHFQINSRDIQPGDVFIALPGQHADGHDFIPDAVERGAVAVLCQRPAANQNIPQFAVNNPIEALALLARRHRARLDCPTIALTGSNGKTTVKEMIAACLPSPSLATSGNLNNHLGVPLMVLRLHAAHRFAVFECGANHPGEIAATAPLCQPDVALVNNIGPAHIEGFGSIEGVARAKGEIYQSLADGKTAIINDDDAYAHFWDDCLRHKNILRFSVQHAADITASHIHYDANACPGFSLQFPHKHQYKLQLQVPGEHMLANACAAAACLWALGISPEAIIKGLSDFGGVQGRQSIYSGLHGARIIDDSYNANLRSALAGIALLARYEGLRILVFGDMGELGVHSCAHHREVGEAAKAAGIEYLFSVGDRSAAASEAFGEGGMHFASKDALLQQLLPRITAETSVLVKGSRSAAMETIVAPLLTRKTPVEG